MKRTSICSLPTHLLVKILWHSNQPISGDFEDDAYECLSPKPRRYGGLPENSITPIPAPPASADTAWNLLVASVCRDWRDLARRHVSNLSVRKDLLVSRQDLANAITRFPNLTHIHLSDGSVEMVDDAFLAHLASACPKLRVLHVGIRINQYYDDESTHPGDSHPITAAGLDRFFTQCPRLEELSLFCLHKDVNLPPSFFLLTHLRTLLLATASALGAPGLANLTSLSTLHIASPNISHEQFLGLRHLSNLNSLSISPQHDANSSSSPSLILPSLRSLEVNGRSHAFHSFFPPIRLGTNLQRLEIRSVNGIARLPRAIGELVPCLRELELSFCQHLTELPDELTSLRRLEKVRISSCEVLSRLPRNLGALPALTQLELYLVPLTHLPDSLCQLTSLNFFSFLNCQMVQQLPAGFSRLTALETLYLGQSRVLMYPDDIGRLSNLKTLLLEGNCEAQRLLPSSLTELSALTRLELKLFQFAELPEDIGMLSNLQHLHICSCFDLTALPDSSSRLTALEILRMDGFQQLSSVPRLDALTRLKRLELIDGFNRRLADPPASLPPSLEILAMPSYSQLAPRFDMPKMPHLRNLELRNIGSGSSLALAMGASRLRRLKLQIAGDAEVLPSPFPVLPHLHTLLLLGSPNLFEDYADLARLPECIGSFVLQLRRLKVEELSLRELPASVCELQCLTSLEIRRSGLVCLPAGISALTRLCKLDVSGCRALQHLPASLTQLTCLDASYTGILSLPSGFARLARLRRLTLNGCEHLEALPHDVTELRMLRYLGVRDCTHVLDREDKVQPDGVYSMYGLEVDDERTMYRRVA